MNSKTLTGYNKERLIIIMRHGERTDLAGFTTEINEFDPELTENGKNQAFEAGRRLKEFMEMKYNDEKDTFLNKNIAIVSSPFTRTLQTAKYLKNGMDLNVPLFIENGLSEFISKGWFKHSPIEFLCYYKLFNQDNNSNNKREEDKITNIISNKNTPKKKEIKILNKEYFLKEFMNEVIINQSVTKLPEFPESTNKCISRFQCTFDELVSYYIKKKNIDIIILVTHLFGIQALCEKMKIPVDYYDVEYCSTFVFNYNEQTGNYKFLSFFHP